MNKNPYMYLTDMRTLYSKYSFRRYKMKQIVNDLTLNNNK